jgi:hypothetical protein
LSQFFDPAGLNRGANQAVLPFQALGERGFLESGVNQVSIGSAFGGEYRTT